MTSTPEINPNIAAAEAIFNGVIASENGEQTVETFLQQDGNEQLRRIAAILIFAPELQEITEEPEPAAQLNLELVRDTFVQKAQEYFRKNRDSS